MDYKEKIKYISKLIARDIASFFPYFLFLYILIFITVFLFSILLSFWQVTLLHFTFIIFGLIFILEKEEYFYIDKFNSKNIKKLIKFSIAKALIFYYEVFKSFWGKIKNGYYVIWIAGLALFLLFFSPLFSIFGKDIIVENSTIYAFLLLIISFILITVENFYD